MTSAGQRNSRNPLVPLLGALLVCGAVFFVVARSGGDDEAAPPVATSTTTTTEATTTTTEAPPPDPVSLDTIAAEPYPETVPASYRITYDVVENTLPRVETITVRRPFESLVISTRDDVVISGSATSRTNLWTYLSDREGWLSIQPELHRAGFDQRPLAAMATMVALGRAEEQGTAEFAGRPCRVFVTGQPLSNAGAVAPSDAESTEVCIDDAGLVLHERWQISGSPVVERTATEVTVTPRIDTAQFDPTPVVDDADEFAAILSTIAVPADETTIAGLRTDIEVPPGYELVATILRSGSPGAGGSGSTIEVVRFYSDGTDLIELAEVNVAAGASLDGSGAVPVDIEGPETWFAPDFRASVIRSRLSETAFVEIRGAEPARLVALLKTLSRR